MTARRLNRESRPYSSFGPLHTPLLIGHPLDQGWPGGRERGVDFAEVRLTSPAKQIAADRRVRSSGSEWAVNRPGAAGQLPRTEMFWAFAGGNR
jgi:hypothetical protein